MGWARIDDGFHDHPKLIGLPLDALGLWVKCLTWAHRHHGSSIVLGHIPAGLPEMFAGSRGPKLAKYLETKTLWDVESNIGGWVIHDYIDYLPAAERPQSASEVSKARSEAGKRGAVARWNKATESQSDSKLPSEPMASTDGKPMPPNPTRPEEEDKSSSRKSEPQREDATKLCNRLADHMANNGVKRPTITTAWRREARLLIDNDGYDLRDIVRVLDWCQADSFWKGNVQSMPTFREKFGQLKLRSEETKPEPKPDRGPRERPGMPGVGMAIQL